MKPLQQLKLTFMTLGSVLRGRALAPSKYKPVPSAVRDEKEVSKIMEASPKGGIKLGVQKKPIKSNPPKPLEEKVSIPEETLSENNIESNQPN